MTPLRLHGRFVFGPRQREAIAQVVRDEETGARALALEPGWFLDEASSFAMASRVRALDAPDLAEILALEPTVIALGQDEGTVSPHPAADTMARGDTMGRLALAHLTLDLLERALELWQDGIVAQVSHAWIVRREQRWALRIPAGLVGLSSLHCDERFFAARWPSEGQLAAQCLHWFSLRDGTEGWPTFRTAREAAQALACRVTDPTDSGLSARADAIVSPRRPYQRIDLDRALTLGRQALDEARLPKGYLLLPLGALLHHHSCVAFARGAHQEALSLLDEALRCERSGKGLSGKGHARYFTTRALFFEAMGRADDARRDHQAAIAALPASQDDAIQVFTGDESIHDARSAHAYGAFLARSGELNEALPWLALGARDAPAILGRDGGAAQRKAAYAVVLTKLGEHQQARVQALSALHIDRAEPSALAVLAFLDEA